MKINELLIKDGKETMYDEDLYLLYEAHVKALDKKSLIQNTLYIDNFDRNKYQGDIHGFLLKEGYAMEYHYFFIKLNSLTGSNDFPPKNMEYLLVPKVSEIEIIAGMVQSAKVKKNMNYF